VFLFFSRVSQKRKLVNQNCGFWCFVASGGFSSFLCRRVEDQTRNNTKAREKTTQENEKKKKRNIGWIFVCYFLLNFNLIAMLVFCFAFIV